MPEYSISTESSGYTAIFGPQIDSLSANFLSTTAIQSALKASKTFLPRHSKAHITLITKEEASSLMSREIRPVSLFPTSILQDLHFVGLGSTSKVEKEDPLTAFHIVVISPAINRIRLKYGLGCKALHVTLTNSNSSSDFKDRAKDLDSLLDQSDLNSGCSLLSRESKDREFDFQEALAKHYLVVGRLDSALETSLKLSVSILDSNEISDSNLGALNADPIVISQLAKSLFALANVAFKCSEFRLSMLSFSQAYNFNAFSETDARISTSCLKGIESCWKFTELGPGHSKEEWSQLSDLPTSLLRILFQPWEPSLKESLRSRFEDQSREMGWNMDQRLVCERGKRFTVKIQEPEVGLFDQKPEDKVRFHEIQRFFSWIIPFRLCASSTPRSAADIFALKTLGITHVLTLTLEYPLPSEWFQAASMDHTFLPVADGRSPSMADYRIFVALALEIMSKKGSLLVHCGGGKGRAGSILSAYLAAFGFETCSKSWAYPQLGASQAMEKVRTLRPGSVETQHQEDGIKSWVHEILQHGAFPKIVEEPEASSPTIVTTSTSSPLTLQSCSRVLAGIDLLILVGLPGSGKSSFRKLLCSRNPERWSSVNGDEDGGRRAVESALSNFGRNLNSQSSSHGLIVDQCSVTAASRKEIVQLAQRCSKPVAVHFDFAADLCHSRAALRSSHPSIKPSSASNIIQSFSKKLEVPTLKEGFSSIITITSFEAANELARVLSPPSICKFPRTPHLLNLGAASADDLVERSALTLTQEVSKGDKQSKPFDPFARYLITEKVDGANIGISLSDTKSLQVQNRSHWISNDPQFKKLEPWLEKHRVELYALLDRDNQGFPGRFVLYGEWLAAQHSIAYTHLDSLFLAFDLYDRTSRTFLPRHQLTEMVQSKSQFCDGRLEGIYIKLESQTKVLSRGKIVRKDFICGNQHWSKGIRKWNGIVNDGRE